MWYVTLEDSRSKAIGVAENGDDVTIRPIDARGVARFARIVEREEIVYDLTPPDKELIEKYLEQARERYSRRNCWIYDPPDIIEAEDNSEMLSKLELPPGFRVVYLRKRRIKYYSDGDPETTEEMIRVEDGRPLLYEGEAWALKFLVQVDGKWQDCLWDNAFIYFREDEGDLRFICSDWCQRNRRKVYDAGINLYSGEWYTLNAWLLGPYQRILQMNRVQMDTVKLQAIAGKALDKEAPPRDILIRLNELAKTMGKKVCYWCGTVSDERNCPACSACLCDDCMAINYEVTS